MNTKKLIAPLVACVLAVSACGAVSDAAQSDAVVLDAGPVSGTDVNGTDAFLGVPYAAPPVGPLRWMPPQPAPHWTETLSTTKPGSECSQNALFGAFANGGGQEDCLYLNVYVKKGVENTSSKLPVLVFFHGGGLFGGSGNDYDGSKLATQGNAVVVTVNYRLGVFGFFAQPDLDAEGHPAANYGYLDQQSSLRWVQRNIAALGGDPGNVTIFGESSGGSAVLTQLISPGAAGLFQHAISESGASVMMKYPNFGSPVPLKVAEDSGSRFAAAAGCGDQSLACLRGLSTQKVLQFQDKYQVVQGIVDGTVLPSTYTDAFRAGKINKATLYVGTDLDEMRWSVGLTENGTGKPMTDADYLPALTTFYGKDLAGKVAAQYPLNGFLTSSEAYAAAISDGVNSCTNRMMAGMLTSQIPTYAFEFADRTAPTYLKPTSFEVGAGHTLELSYLFAGFHGGSGTPPVLDPMQEKLSAKMIEYWSTAALASARESEWPRYDAAQDNVMTLILPAPEMRSGRFAEYHHCGFWDGLGIY